MNNTAITTPTPECVGQETRPLQIRLTDAEIAAVREATKVDAVAPGVVACVRRYLELYKGLAR